MTGKSWKSIAAAVLLAAMAPLASAGAAAAFAPGDPDGDGLPTLEEQALGTDPLRADSDGDGLLDGWEVYFTATSPATDPLKAATNGLNLDGNLDRDGGGISDAQELANGTNPNSAADDAKLRRLKLTAPAPTSANGFALPVVPYDRPDNLGNVLSYTTPSGAFIRFQLQFDGSATFDSPVSSEFTHTLDRANVITQVRNLWTRVTQEGRLVYWRILGEINGAPEQVVSSNILSFTVVNGTPLNGPRMIGPANGFECAAGTSPSLAWAGTGFAGWRLVFTGSKTLGARIFIPVPNAGPLPVTQTSAKLGWKRLANISALGEEITWQVIGQDRYGRWCWSKPRVFKFAPGASSLTATPGTKAYLPAQIPTFSAASGAGTQWQILFSMAEDFSSPAYVYPSAATRATGAISWTPDAAAWTAISGIGPDLFWTVRSFSPDVNCYYYPTGFNQYDMGRYLSIAGLEAAPGVNPLGPSLQSFSLQLAPGPEADAYRVIVCGDRRCSGTRALDPPGAMADNTAWPAAYSQAPLPADFPTRIAGLNANYLWLAVRGRDPAGSSGEGNTFFFSEPRLVKADTFLRAPALNVAADAVKVNTAYSVTWGKSPDDLASPDTVLYYELQEATDSAFSLGLRSLSVNALAASFTKSSADVGGGTVRYYYRVRAVNSFGHGGWSNVDAISVAALTAWSPRYVTGPAWPMEPPFCDLYGTTNNFAVDDFQPNNDEHDNGTFDVEGTGWARVSQVHHKGHGFWGDAVMVSRANPISGHEKATWRPKIKVSGTYAVWVTWYMSDNRADHVEYFLKSDSGASEQGPFVVDQRQNLDYPGTQTWVSLGKFRFTAGGSYYVQLRYNPAYNNAAAGTHSLCADAVIFRYREP